MKASTPSGYLGESRSREVHRAEPQGKSEHFCRSVAGSDQLFARVHAITITPCLLCLFHLFGVFAGAVGSKLHLQRGVSDVYNGLSRRTWLRECREWRLTHRDSAFERAGKRLQIDVLVCL